MDFRLAISDDLQLATDVDFRLTLDTLLSTDVDVVEWPLSLERSQRWPDPDVHGPLR